MVRGADDAVGLGEGARGKGDADRGRGVDVIRQVCMLAMDEASDRSVGDLGVCVREGA
jgi:hypothetical protein